MIIAGIDPGNKGCIALVDFQGPIVRTVDILRFNKLNIESSADVRTIYMYLLSNNIQQVYLEKVNPYKAGRRAWKVLGLWFGTLHAASVAAGHVPVVVHSSKWMKSLDCLTGGDKNVTKRMAERLYGKKLNIIHDIADGLLIATYGNREYRERVRLIRKRNTRPKKGKTTRSIKTPW